MESLIDAVRRYPCLWNTSAIEYRDQELKDAAWAEVMKETDLSSVKDVKQKWKKVRDSYRDALKRASEGAAREGGRRGCPWKYMGQMQFLQPHMNNRKKPAESPPPAPAANGLPSDEESCSSGSSPRRPPPAARARRREPAPAATDPMDMFFASMCQATRRLPYAAQLRIKKLVFSAVLEAEEALVAEQQSYAALWARGPPPAASSDSDEPPDPPAA